MEKKALVVIGFILLGFLTFGASPLQASSVDGHTEEVEYTGEDPSDTIRVKEVLGLQLLSIQHPAMTQPMLKVKFRVPVATMEKTPMR